MDQQPEGLRKLNLDRDQILARLWELADLSHEVARGIVAGQIKALSMILAMDRFPTAAAARPTRLAALPEADICTSEWRRKQLPATSRLLALGTRAGLYSVQFNKIPAKAAL